VRYFCNVGFGNLQNIAHPAPRVAPKSRHIPWRHDDFAIKSICKITAASGLPHRQPAGREHEQTSAANPRQVRARGVIGTIHYIDSNKQTSMHLKS
jgi:hypothetical protein